MFLEILNKISKNFSKIWGNFEKVLVKIKTRDEKILRKYLATFRGIYKK